jgi:hypothetical protein
MMAATLVLALLGVFGHGPLSRAGADSADGLLRLRYERFTRVRAPTTLRLTIDPRAAGADGLVRLWIDAGYLSGAERLEILPGAVAEGAAGGRYRYAIPAAGEAPVDVRLRFEADAAGVRRGVIGLETADESRSVIRFRQFAYP